MFTRKQLGHIICTATKMDKEKWKLGMARFIEVIDIKPSLVESWKAINQGSFFDVVAKTEA